MALSLSEKKNIDLLAPTVLATLVAGGMIIKKQKDYRVLLLVIVGVWLASYLVTTRITKSIYENGPAPVPTGGGCDNFDPKPFTDAVKDDVYSGILTARKVQPYKDLLKLADCQLIKVYNDWNDRYYALDKETIKVAMSGEITGIEFDSLRTQIFSKFQTLGLN